MPAYAQWERLFYGAGLTAYDLLAGRAGFGRSVMLSSRSTLGRLPTLNPDGLRGGILYYDGQFDDARLLVNLVQTAAEHGAVLLNYAAVHAISTTAGTVDGVVATDTESGTELRLPARVVVNATGRVRGRDQTARRVECRHDDRSQPGGAHRARSPFPARTGGADGAARR